MIVDVEDVGHVGQRGRPVGEQRGGHQLEHAVLRAGDAHLARQARATDDPEAIHATPS